MRDDPFAYLDEPVTRIRIHAYGDALFRCGSCGRQAAIAPDMICEWISPEATCEECCPDHLYQYEPYEGTRCTVCNASPPDDYFTD